MDDERFDALIRRLGASVPSRRSLVAALLGAIVVGGGPNDGADARGNGKNKAKRRHDRKRDGRRDRRANARKRRQEQRQEPPPQEPATAAKKCRGQGHPCEGNQTCCAPFTCVVSGPGNAERCTPCPSGTVYFQGACCTPSTCAAEGAECGQIGDGCGGTLECGDCPLSGQPCQGNICGTCVPDCAAKECGADDGCGGACEGDCPNGQFCIDNPAPACEACSAANSLPDLCAPHDGVICGMANNIIPECWCVQTVAGGALCTNFASTLCHCDPDEVPGCTYPPNTPICTTDDDCVAQGYTHCIPSPGCVNCNGGRSCAIECAYE